MVSRTAVSLASAIVADTSGIISLVATGVSREILTTLPAPLRVVRTVLEELEAGRKRWTTLDEANALLSEGYIVLVDLDEVALRQFESMVVGPAADTLDDGEAATIAYAASEGIGALIDEKKAWRLCRERFPVVEIMSTASLLMCTRTTSALGLPRVGNALFNALTSTRMRVPDTEVANVIALLGSERIAQCTSLPLRFREAARVPSRLEANGAEQQHKSRLERHRQG